jgi:hypothetical protein
MEQKRYLRSRLQAFPSIDQARRHWHWHSILMFDLCLLPFHARLYDIHQPAPFSVQHCFSGVSACLPEKVSHNLSSASTSKHTVSHLIPLLVQVRVLVPAPAQVRCQTEYGARHQENRPHLQMPRRGWGLWFWVEIFLLVNTSSGATRKTLLAMLG